LYQGLYGVGVERRDIVSAATTALTCGGKISFKPGNYHYGASLVPDENEFYTLPVRYTRLLDPDSLVVEVKDPTSSRSNRSSKYGPRNPLIQQDSACLGKSAKIILHVEDLNDSIAFYTECLGMNLLRKRANINSKPKEASMVGYVVRNSTI
jgi:hypothetical protein